MVPIDLNATAQRRPVENRPHVRAISTLTPAPSLLKLR